MATIGRTSIGSGSRNLSQGCKGLRLTTTQAAAAGVSVWAHISDTDGAGEEFAAVIVASDLQTILAVSTARTDVSTLGWYQFTGGDFTTYAPASGLDCVICVASVATSGATVSQDTTATGGQVGNTSLDAVADLSPFTWGSTPGMTVDATRNYSVYLEYTPAGSGILRQAMAHHG